MSETKFSVMRQYGTEQFSMTITMEKVPNKKEVESSLDALNLGISSQFERVQGREISEKKLLAARAIERREAVEALDKELKAENLAVQRASRNVK